MAESMGFEDRIRAERALRTAMVGTSETYSRLYLTDAWFKSMIDGQASFIVHQMEAYVTHAMVMDGERAALIMDKMREGLVSRSWFEGLD